MKTTIEKDFKPISGYAMLLLLLLFPLLITYSIFQIVDQRQYHDVTSGSIVLWITCIVIGVLGFIITASGFMVVEPNGSRVLTLFGDYKGTVRENGFFWTNPFFTKKNISLRARNMETEQIKVNDKMGNPIIIGAVLVWRVKETYRAAFDVDNYETFVRLQSEAAIRQLASSYAYDHFEDETAEVTLRSNSNVICDILEHQLTERCAIAGIEIMEARISHLSYSAEIASAMLQRQQATAIVAARSKIVEGAVGMVQMALHELSSKQIIELDDDKKAAMVSNLLVVLCGERSTTPVINAGTLHQ